jgi:hypothetical protein
MLSAIAEIMRTANIYCAGEPGRASFRFLEQIGTDWRADVSD